MSPSIPYFPLLPTSLEGLERLAPDDWKAVIAAEPKVAVPWMEQAAELGHTDAQITMGQWLLDGHGTERDPARALGLFLKAAQKDLQK